MPNNKTWNDFTEFVQSHDARGWVNDEPQAAPSGDPGKPAPLDLISALVSRHLHLTPARHVALTLWIGHTFVYNRFKVTPRLALVSPVRGCGKTTALGLVENLSFNAHKLDHITAAVLFRLIDGLRATVLLDEGDNQDLPTNSILRSVINSGHADSGKISRYLSGTIQTFKTSRRLRSL